MAFWERRHWFFLALQLAISICVFWWWRHLPLPGYSVALMAVAAAFMSLHAEMTGAHKAVWMLIIGALLIVELRAIRKDRDDYDIKHDAEWTQNENDFTAIGNRIGQAIENSQQQFDATMSRYDQLFATEALIRKEEEQLSSNMQPITDRSISKSRCLRLLCG